MKFESTNDDLFSALNNIATEERSVPSNNSTGLFSTLPGQVVYLRLQHGTSDACTHRISISNEMAKKDVIQWLEKAEVNLWNHPTIERTGDAVVTITALFDWAVFPNGERACEYIGDTLSALITHANHRRTMAAAKQQNWSRPTTSSRSPY
ncbi:hypothetical protein AH06_200 [Erwinia phage AH06]|nr:hypothetical protein AH06_200 [Erwinia phage AH06]